MSYIISKDNNKYIKYDSNNKSTLTTNRCLAVEFITEYKAKQYIENCVKPKDRYKYKIEEKENVTISFDSENIDNVIDNELKYQLTSLDESQIDWEQTCEWLHDLYSDLPQYKINLQIKRKEIEGELIDIQHYIELNPNMNACNGFKAYKMLKDVLERRRKIKDEIYIVNSLINAGRQQHIDGSLLDIFTNRKNRKYAPRVLNELFEN